MAIPSIRYLALAKLIMIAGILMFSGNRREVTAQGCGDLESLISKCMKFVAKSGPKIPPTEECCAVLKTIDVPCVCKLVTAEIEKIISMEKVVYVAQACGLQVPHGTKCGSYTIPLA